MSEPSQTAKERAERVWDNYSGYEGKGNFIPAVTWEITAAEQAAFQRGKEEGRREAEDQVRRILNKLHASWSQAELKAVPFHYLYVDPPAQPAATILDDYERGRKAGKEEGRREERERILNCI